MKFWPGFATGAIMATILLMVIGFFIESKQNDSLGSDETLPGLIMLPEKGGCIIKNEMKIFQTLKPNVALAQSGAYPNEKLVLLINYSGELYYDDQKIKMKANECARQVGTYQYTTKADMLKTVPVVVIE